MDSVAGSVERPTEAVVGGNHGGYDGANAGSGDDVEIISDLRVGIAGLGSDLVLEVDEGCAGDNGGGSSTVDTENAGFGCGFVVGKPLLLEFGEDLERYFAKLHCVECYGGGVGWLSVVEAEAETEGGSERYVFGNEVVIMVLHTRSFFVLVVDLFLPLVFFISLL